MHFNSSEFIKVQKQVAKIGVTVESLQSGHFFKMDGLPRNGWIYSQTRMKKSPQSGQL